MKPDTKVKLNKLCRKKLTGNTVRDVILFIPLVYIFVKWVTGENLSVETFIEKFLDVSILITFIFVFISDHIATGIVHFVSKKTEDAVKLTEDYDKVTKRYSKETRFVKIPKDKKINTSEDEDKDKELPVIELAFRSSKEKVFAFNFKLAERPYYNLPKQIADNSDAIFEAHQYSKTYNSRMLRVFDFGAEEKENQTSITLQYGYTAYYDSLITNRAMDYPVVGNRTVRDIYEPGPFVTPLRRSKLSNHLGFNGFVELEDGNIIFIHRSTNLSIAKGLWATSVSASYKLKYGVEDDGSLTERMLYNAIAHEIVDELKLKPKDLLPPEGQGVGWSGNNNIIFAFYRDLVEGGKPQFLFYYKCSNGNCIGSGKDKYEKAALNAEEFKKNFNYVAAKEKKEKDVTIDGSQFDFLSIEDLRNAKMGENILTVTKNGKEKTYKMNPAAIASIILLLRYLEVSTH